MNGPGEAAQRAFIDVEHPFRLPYPSRFPAAEPPVSRLGLAIRALTGELNRDLGRVGVMRADELQVGWVVRIPSQGRGKRWWIRGLEGPVGQYSLITLTARLVEVHGVRSRSRLREMGLEPDRDKKLNLRDNDLLVVDYRDWSDDANPD